MNAFKDSTASISSNPNTKLGLYAKVKTRWGYEKYLNSSWSRKYITKFRLSDHFLPIERGRYHNPIIPRCERLCPYCKLTVGDEIHAIMECSAPVVLEINNSYIEHIISISPDFQKISTNDKFYYIMNANDSSLFNCVGEWFSKINQLYKNNC